MVFKIGFLKNFAIFTGKHPCWSFFLIKLQAFRQLFLKKARIRVFPSEHWEVLKNSFFYKTLAATSVVEANEL